MRTAAVLLSGAGFLLASAVSSIAEQRCGWLENPTPANWWLIDKDDTWIIGVQGGAQADGMDYIGDLSTGDFVTENGSHGYACACMTVVTDAKNSQITRILSFKQLKMSKCRNDAALPSAPDQ
jgi:hypothetical protein